MSIDIRKNLQYIFLGIKIGSMSTTTTDKVIPVRVVRDALGITQEEMARRMGCSISSERRFEYDRSIPTVTAVKENFRKLAKQAGVEVEGL
jgi:predicted transcriptional regulator